MALLLAGCGENEVTPLGNEAPEFAVIIGPDALCISPGGSVDLEVVLIARGTPPYTYAWTFDAPGVRDSDEAAPIVTFEDKVCTLCT